jgi:hypothetical protein
MYKNFMINVNFMGLKLTRVLVLGSIFIKHWMTLNRGLREPLVSTVHENDTKSQEVWIERTMHM